jgi:hypothetical protein
MEERIKGGDPYRELWNHVSLKDCLNLIAVWLLLLQYLKGQQWQRRKVSKELKEGCEGWV